MMMDNVGNTMPTQLPLSPLTSLFILGRESLKVGKILGRERLGNGDTLGMTRIVKYRRA